MKVRGYGRSAVSIIALVVAVAAANWITARYGFVPVGFGLMATSGTYAAGAALVARDYVHDHAGLRGVVVAIVLGGVVSWFTSEPALAVASTLAFLVAETVDAFVYAPLRVRAWRTAVVASSVVGATVDTLLFLRLAFGPEAITTATVAGQLVGKVLWVAVPVAVVGGYVRERG